MYCFSHKQVLLAITEQITDITSKTLPQNAKLNIDLCVTMSRYQVLLLDCLLKKKISTNNFGNNVLFSHHDQVHHVLAKLLHSIQLSVDPINISISTSYFSKSEYEYEKITNDYCIDLFKIMNMSK